MNQETYIKIGIPILIIGLGFWFGGVMAYIFLKSSTIMCLISSIPIAIGAPAFGMWLRKQI